MVEVDSIVNACVEQYKAISKSGKPTAEEWTVVSAVVGVFDNVIKVLSLGTGSKCLGRSSLSPRGDVLNDSHAEVIARRAFLKYLYLEIIKLNETKSSEVFCREDGDGMCVRVKGGVKFYFVTSMSPCGDASIMPKCETNGRDSDYGSCLEFTEPISQTNNLKRSHNTENFCAKKPKIEETQNDYDRISETNPKDIHRTGAKCLPASTIQDPHLPGVLYHSLGAIRTKPGRGDPTSSLSCSDKLARWNAVGWQGALLSFFIKDPVLMESIICGGGCPFSKDSFNRAVNERINKTEFVPIHQSRVPFPDLKEEGKKPNSSSVIWWRGLKTSEVSINGRKQGVTKKNLNKKTSRTSICKKELLIMFEKTVNTSAEKKKFLDDLGVTFLTEITYGELKSKAREYQTRWKITKNDYLKVWADKPKELLNFSLKED